VQILALWAKWTFALPETHQTLPTDRKIALAALRSNTQFDLAVIGGGATGLGVALDAQVRGLKVVLLEAQDFANGTSSRSTKLLHGGVRYLAQGKLGLVTEALRERTTILHNAPHLAQALSFVMPCYKHWEAPFYGVGLKIYDVLAGTAGLGHTRILGRQATLSALPGARAQGLKAGVQFWDGQFDDARLAIALARTATTFGALLLNHCKVEQLLYTQERVSGLQVREQESGELITVSTSCVINASGVWVDQLLSADAASLHKAHHAMVAPSQGVHLVLDADFLPGDKALLIPATADGRVLFAVPWLGKVVLGTTDTPRLDLPLEPQAYPAEIDFILREAGRYLARPPTKHDVRSMWVGLRPLVHRKKCSTSALSSTKKISREHVVESSASGLVTVTGGKWTTYRAMAQDVLEHCFEHQLLPRSEHGKTRHLRLDGAPEIGAAQTGAVAITAPPGEHLYGTHAAILAQLPGHQRWLAPGLSEAMVRFAARYEFARTTEDVLARRSRLLFLDAALAISVAPKVAILLEEELGTDPQLARFIALAQRYLLKEPL
jgi:glycerol-3-phosphate dehydrogenase